MNFKEIETKYRADNITLKGFTEFAKARKPAKFTMASGYDFFYASPKDTTGFGRHRIGEEFNQLTFKRKTVSANNYVRDEDNLDLALSLSFDRSCQQAQSFFDKFGYGPIKSIYKNCFIYDYPTYTLVYYIIYDEELKELGRFVEIEMSEKYDWGSAAVAWDALLGLEKECRPLGIVPQARVKKSLYEIVCE